MTVRRTASVRVRITALATVVVAIAIAVAAFALVRSVENKLRDRIESADAARAAIVARRLQSGVPLDMLELPPAGGGAVLIQDLKGDVRKVSGAYPSDESFLTVLAPPLPGEVGNIEVAAYAPGAGAGIDTPYNVAYRGVATPEGAFTVLAASPLDEVEQSVATLKGTLVFGLPFLVALVGCVAWFMTGRALRPVEAIRTEVEAISGGTLHRRVPEPSTGDEIARLAHTMNAMLDRLEGAATRQRQFASDASHELRSPVATIRTELEVALRESDADWPSVAERVLAEEDRLEALVADLLLLASVDEDAGPPLTTVDLVPIVRDEAERIRPTPTTFEARDDAVLVAGRAPQLTRVVANLFDNACRHATSTVTASVDVSDGRVRLVVDDDGPGIAKDDRERVFERFTRLDGARSRADQGGAGLGLALVRAVVDAHDGSVRVKKAPIGGARFVVELPLREADDGPAPLDGDGTQAAVGVDGDGVAGGAQHRDIAGGVGVRPRRL